MKLLTICAHCGPDVRIDEDGCCVGCGCDASGQGVDMVRQIFQQMKSRISNLENRIKPDTPPQGEKGKRDDKP